MKKFLSILTLAASIACTVHAADVNTDKIRDMLGGTSITATNNSTNVVSTAVPVKLKPGQPIVITPVFACPTNTAAVSNLVFNFTLSPDETNWLTTGLLSGSAAMNGTNTVVAGFQFTAAQLAGYKAIKLYSVGNQSGTNAATVPKVIYGSWYTQ